MLHFPLGTGQYVTESGENATLTEVCGSFVCGKVGGDDVMWTMWGATSRDDHRLVKKVFDEPKPV